jgi:hypothetical protein
LSKASSTESGPALPIVGEITILAIKPKTLMLSKAMISDGMDDGIVCCKDFLYEQNQFAIETENNRVGVILKVPRVLHSTPEPSDAGCGLGRS